MPPPPARVWVRVWCVYLRKAALIIPVRTRHRSVTLSYHHTWDRVFSLIRKNLLTAQENIILAKPTYYIRRLAHAKWRMSCLFHEKCEGSCLPTIMSIMTHNFIILWYPEPAYTGQSECWSKSLLVWYKHDDMPSAVMVGWLTTGEVAHNLG